MITSTANSTSGSIVSSNDNNSIQKPSTFVETSDAAKLQVEKYVLHLRKIKLVNENFASFLDCTHSVFIPNQKNTNPLLLVLGFDTRLKINDDLVKKIIEDVMPDKKLLPSWALYGLLATAVKGLYDGLINNIESARSAVVTGVYVAMTTSICSLLHRALGPEPFYFKIERKIKHRDLSFMRLDMDINLPNILNTINFSDIPRDIKVKYSPLKNINLALLFKALHENLGLKRNQTYPMTKAFYLGLMTTWIELSRSKNEVATQPITIEEQEKLNNMLTTQIIKNTLSILELDTKLIFYQEAVKSESLENAQCLTEALTLIQQESQQISNNKKIRDKIRSKTIEQHAEIVKSLTEGFYFMDSTTNEIIRVNDSSASLPKYTCYLPMSEVEFTTNSAESLAHILKKISCFLCSDFYPLDVKSLTNHSEHIDINNSLAD